MEGRLVLEDAPFISGYTVEVMSLVKGTYQVEVIRNDEKLQRVFIRQ